MPRGGARPNSGPKPKKIKELERSFASDILTPEIESTKWKLALDSRDQRVMLDALKFLSDHKYGRAPQEIKHDGEIAHRVVSDL